VWHITPLLSERRYFLRACDITWGCHVAKYSTGKTANLAWFWDFNSQTSGPHDMDMGRQIWECLIGWAITR